MARHYVPPRRRIVQARASHVDRVDTGDGDDGGREGASDVCEDSTAVCASLDELPLELTIGHDLHMHWYMYVCVYAR